MSEPISPLPSPEPGGPTPGQIIRQAREAMGLHIVALAAVLKVPVRKLEALEANRWEELTDVTFTRALASSVARHLKIDASPVLAGLPSAALASLNVPGGLGRVENGGSPVLALAPVSSVGRPAWMVGALLVGAAALYFSPELKALWPAKADAPAEAALVTTPVNGVPVGVGVEPVAEASAPAAPAAPLVSTPVSPVGTSPQVVSAVGPDQHAPSVTPSPHSTSDASSLASAVPERLLVLTASVDTWVEVTDSGKRLRIQRVLKQGEEAVFAEGAPFAVVVGNAAGARVMVRGQPLELAAITKNNVARFEVK